MLEQVQLFVHAVVVRVLKHHLVVSVKGIIIIVKPKDKFTKTQVQVVWKREQKQQVHKTSTTKEKKNLQQKKDLPSQTNNENQTFHVIEAVNPFLSL